jgi:hypothetical protein
MIHVYKLFTYTIIYKDILQYLLFDERYLDMVIKRVNTLIIGYP